MSISDEAANSARVKELMVAPPVTRSKHSKALQAVRNVSVIVAFLALGLAVVAVNRQADTTHNIQVASCVQGNQARAQAVQLWQYIIDQSRRNNPDPTAKQVAQLGAFERKVNETYAPRDCSQLEKQ